MKKFWLVVLATATMVTSCEPAFAGRGITPKGDAAPRVKDAARVLVLPDIPEKLPADIEHDLVTGKIPEAILKGPVGATTWSFDFPWVTSTTDHFDKIVSYSAKTGWAPPRAAPVRQVKTAHHFETFVLFWIPALFILVMSMLARAGTSAKNTLFFYIAVFGGAMGGTVDPMIGFFGGVLACGISGSTVAKNAELGFFAGALTGACVGASMGYIETTLHSQSLAAQYWFFLFVVECVSFVLSRTVFLKKEMLY